MQLPVFRIIKHVLSGHGATFAISYVWIEENKYIFLELKMWGVSNDLNRKQLYQDCGVVEPEGRRKLPYCVEAKIRQCFAEENGLSMGLKDY